MDLKIEHELSKIKTHIIDYPTLKSILSNLGYENINDKINNLKQKNIIKSLKKGYFIHTSITQKNIFSKELISNTLLAGPSYISLDYALYYYGLIPETVHEITAVTTNRSKIFKTEFGVYSYRQIKKELFTIAIKSEKTESGYYFLIAEKEKALCDKIFFSKDVKIYSMNSLLNFIENDLRIDIDILKDFNSEIVSHYYKISKSKKIKILLNILKKHEHN